MKGIYIETHQILISVAISKILLVAFQKMSEASERVALYLCHERWHQDVLGFS